MFIYARSDEARLVTPWPPLRVDQSWADLTRRGYRKSQVRKIKAEQPGAALRRAACQVLNKPDADDIIVWLERANPLVDVAFEAVIEAALLSGVLAPPEAAEMHVAPEIYVLFSGGQLVCAPQVESALAG